MPYVLPGPITLGPFTLTLLSDGTFWIDGGSMFGQVPRTIWEKTQRPDARNRIALALNCLLIQSGSQNILVDTGWGPKIDEKTRTIYTVEQPSTLIEELQNKAGLTPQDIDWVILTHLHIDHTGGSTCFDQTGQAVPLFRRARHVVQRAEWEEACNPTDLSKASYLSQDFQPLQDHGLLELVDGDQSVAEGVEVLFTGGHSRGHQIVRIQTGGKTAVFFADLVPTVAHLPPHYIPALDIMPLETLSMKKKYLSLAWQEQWLVIFDHEVSVAAGYLTRDEKRRYRVKSVIN